MKLYGIAIRFIKNYNDIEKIFLIDNDVNKIKIKHKKLISFIKNHNPDNVNPYLEGENMHLEFVEIEELNKKLFIKKVLDDYVFKGFSMFNTINVCGEKYTFLACDLPLFYKEISPLKRFYNQKQKRILDRKIINIAKKYCVKFY